MQNTPIVSLDVFKDLIRHVAFGPDREPIFAWGASGIGKSDAPRQVCAELGADLVDIRLSQFEAIDFRGLPDLDRDSALTEWKMPATLPFKGNPNFNPDKPILLFLDEINQGQPSTLATCYQLIQDRRVGEHELLDSVAIVAAGNRSSDKGVTQRFPAPLGNRGIQVEVEASVEVWSRWAAQAGLPAMLIGFLNFRPALLHTFDPKQPDGVFATPRAWARAAQHFLNPVLPELAKWAAVGGRVGMGPASEFQAFVGLIDKLPHVRDIVAHPDTTPVPDEMDKQWAIASMLSGHMRHDDRLPNIQKYLSRLSPEMVVVAWQMTIQRDDAIVESPTFLMDYAPKYRTLFQR